MKKKKLVPCIVAILIVAIAVGVGCICATTAVGGGLAATPKNRRVFFNFK